jgi:CHAT domain-containing protein/tetratricopeptide (TPR) repeat protein
MPDESIAKKGVRTAEQIQKLCQQGQYQKAIYLAADLCELHLRTYGYINAGYASSLHTLAESYRLRGKNDVAERLFLQVLEIYGVTIGDRNSNYAISQNSLGLLYHHAGDFQAAELLFLRALCVLRETVGYEDPEYAASLHNLALLYGDMGDFDAAEPLFLEAHAIMQAKIDKQHPGYALSTTSLANFYYFTRNFQAAEPLFLQALDVLSETVGDKDLKFGATLSALANLYYDVGKYEAAEPLYLQALDITRTRFTGQVRAECADVLHSLGVLYHVMGDLRKAEILLLQALEIRGNALGERSPKFGATLHHLAELYHAMRRYEEAESLCFHALNVVKDAYGEQNSSYGAVLANLGKLYLSMGKYEAAEPLLRDSLDTAGRVLGKQHPDYATCLHTFGAYYLTIGDYEAAEPLLRESLEILRLTTGEQHPYYVLFLSSLVCVLAVSDRTAEAFKLATESASLLDQVIAQVFSTGSESQRLAFLERIRHFTYLLLSLTQLCPDSVIATRAAMDLVLRRKAIGTEALAIQRDTVLGGKYPALMEQLARLGTVKRQIAQKMLTGPRPDGIEMYRLQLSEWFAKRESLEAKLAREIPEMNLELQLNQANYEDIAHALPQDTALIEFVRFPFYNFEAVRARGEKSWEAPRYLVFVMRARAPETLVMIDLGDANQIDKLIRSFRMSVMPAQTESCDSFSRFNPAADISGAALRAAVFDSVVPHLGGATRLFIAPDGELTRVPFEALSDGDGRNLIDKYHISYLTTGRDLLRFRHRTGSKSSSSVIIADPDFDLGSETIHRNNSARGSVTNRKSRATSGARNSRDLFKEAGPFPRLKGTAEEGEKIAEALDVRAWLQERALEGSLKDTTSPRILHIATHGFFLANQQSNTAELVNSFTDGNLNQIALPTKENYLLRSGLVLAGVNTWLAGGTPPQKAEDGILTAEDVSGLNLLATDLVVLSACETGLGALHASEGVYGLRRTFVLAGAKTLVMSLWNVPDEETKDLMIDFYARVLRGESRADALRNAQLKIKSTCPDPFYWGAFICQGDPGPLDRFEQK